jgi:hypothetical protein
MTEEEAAIASRLAVVSTGIGFPNEHHAQVSVDGVEVDEGIAELIRACWANGLVTMSSCQDLGNSSGACIVFATEEMATTFAAVAAGADDEYFAEDAVVWFDPSTIDAIAEALHSERPC